MAAAGATSDVVVGVDIGTTSVKAVAFTPDAVARADAAAAYPLLAPRPGYAEQDSDAVLEATLRVTADVAREVQAAGHLIAAISVSGAMHGLIALDAADRPATPLLTWADARAGEQARRLRAEPRGLAIHRRTGTPVHPMSPLVKLRWYSEREPDVFAGAQRWVGVKERVLHALTGEWVVDQGIASAMGLFNLGDEDWDAEALAWARITAGQLPALVPTTAVLHLSPEGARRLGVPPGTPLVAGGSDGPLANLGLGAVAGGTVACSIGTSGALRVAADAPRVDYRGRVFCYVLAPGRWIVGGAINNGGSVLDWVADALAPELAGAAVGNRIPALLHEAAQAAAGSGGLLFVPHLLGERAPRWADGARGAYVGLTRQTGRPQLVRAAVEGVCLQLALVLGSLGDAGIAVEQIRATGGFSRSPLWRRMLASVFGRPVGFAASPEGSSLGAALLGMHAIGMLEDLDDAARLVPIETVEQPDEDEAEIYADVLPVFERVVDGLAEASAALTALHRTLPERPAAGAPER